MENQKSLLDWAFDTQVQEPNPIPSETSKILIHVGRKARNLDVCIKRYDKDKAYSVRALQAARKELREALPLLDLL